MKEKKKKKAIPIAMHAMQRYAHRNAKKQREMPHHSIPHWKLQSPVAAAPGSFLNTEIEKNEITTPHLQTHLYPYSPRTHSSLRQMQAGSRVRHL